MTGKNGKVTNMKEGYVKREWKNGLAQEMIFWKNGRMVWRKKLKNGLVKGMKYLFGARNVRSD